MTHTQMDGSSGSITWAISGGGSGNDWGYALATGSYSPEAVLVSGGFRSPYATFGKRITAILASEGSSDVFLWKVNCVRN